jgi:hypothetical protein
MAVDPSTAQITGTGQKRGIMLIKVRDWRNADFQNPPVEQSFDLEGALIISAKMGQDDQECAVIVVQDYTGVRFQFYVPFALLHVGYIVS